MFKKTIVIIVCLLLMANVLTTILVKNDSVVSASSSSQERKIDYYFMYDVIKKLCEIANDSVNGVDHGIYKGRNFGTTGERYVADTLLYKWITDNTKNLDSNLVLERIGNDTYGYTENNKQRLANNNLEILDYGLSFRDSTSGPPDAIIPLNETYPFPSFTSFSKAGIMEDDIVGTGDNYYEVQFDPKAQTNSYDDVNQCNISYATINESDLIEGDVTFIDNYSIAPMNQTEDKIHLINVSDSEFNDTITMLVEHNASGFILIRDDISHLINWTLDLPGIAVSEENGSYLKNFTKNGTVSVFPDENSEQNILNVFHYNYSTLPICEKKIYLVNQSYIVDNWGWFLKRDLIRKPFVEGFIFFNSNYPKTHFHFPSASISYGVRRSYSRLAVPAFSINGSILVNGQMKNFEQWVIENENTSHPVMAKFWIKQRKNDQAISYNVYCNIQGKNPNKYFLLSGGHYEAWWGQSMSDNAAGVAVMMGILKYFNDSKITPKSNLQFIFHGGHENTARGSKSHTYNLTNLWVLKHTDYMINLDMLAHYFQHSWFRINCSNEKLQKIVKAIVNTAWYNETFQDQNYYSTVGREHAGSLGFVDAKAYFHSRLKGNRYRPPYGIDINYINFNKNNSINYHQSGSDNTEGDTLQTLDKKNLNVTAGLIWNVTKYFTVDPDCSFKNIDQPWLKDSNDDNPIADSVQINYTINTTLPQDRAMVKAILFANAQPGHPLYPIRFRYVEYKNYTVTPTEITDHITVALPSNAPFGTYTLKVFLYNSTGIVDNAVYGLDTYDLGLFTNESHIYPDLAMGPPNDIPDTPTISSGPEGELQVWTPYSFTASATDPNGDQVEYQWNWRANKLVPWLSLWQGPFPSGVDHTMWHMWFTTGDFDVTVRARDIYRGPTFSDWSDPYHVEDMAVDCGISAELKVLNGQEINYETVNYGATEPIQNYTWNLDYNPGAREQDPSTYAYVRDPCHTFMVTGVKYQLLTLRDALGENYSCEHTTQVLNIISNFIVNRTGAKPNSRIQFTNTSLACTGHSINNVTWDFGDQTHVHTQNPTHSYASPGSYNVTLTVKHGFTDTDVSWQVIHIDTTPPAIVDVTYSPYFLVSGTNITLYADVFENGSGIDQVKVNITTPENTTGNYTMMASDDSFYNYQYTFTDTWTPGYYNFTIWAKDNAGNVNSTSMYWFKISDSSPDDGATGVSINPILSVQVDDPNEDTANVSFYQYFPNSYVINSENDWKAGTFTSTRTDGSGNLILANDTSPYGTGANGDYTVTSSIALTGNKNYRNLTINAGKTLNTAGYTVRVLGKLLNYGTITDSTTGGAGGSYGAGGQGQDPKGSGPSTPEAGSAGSSGSAGSKATSGSGGRGGAGGGGAGGAWHTLSNNDANGGDGGNGGTGGKGGGTVKIYVFKLDNQGVIHANGSAGGNGVSGTAGEHWDFYYLGSRDISGGGGGGGGGGNGGIGGTVNITFGVLLHQGKIYAAGGAKGTKGSYGSRQYNTYGINLGGEANGASGGSGGGAGSGGAGGKGEYSAGYSDNGVNGNDGVAGVSGATILHHVLNYVTVGSYYRVLNVGSAVEWNDPVITATIPADACVVVTYGENTTGIWRYYENITLLPSCRWLKVRVNLTTNNLTMTPSVDKISLSTRTLLHIEVNVSHDTNATYQWSGRSLNTLYYWQVRIYNKVGDAYGPVWDFRTTS